MESLMMRLASNYDCYRAIEPRICTAWCFCRQDTSVGTYITTLTISAARFCTRSRRSIPDISHQPPKVPDVCEAIQPYDYGDWLT